MSGRTIASTRIALQNTLASLRFSSGNVTTDRFSVASSSTFNPSTSSWSLFLRLHYWAVPSVAASIRSYIMSQGTNGIFGLKGTTPTPAFGIDNGSSISPFSTNASVGNWYWIVLTYNSTNKNWNLYVNGALDSTTLNISCPSSTSAHIFGHHNSTVTWGTKGYISGIALIKRIATQAEATGWYSNGIVPTDNLEYYFKHKEGTGTILTDETGVYTGVVGASVNWDTTFVPTTPRVLRTTRMYTLRPYTNSLDFNGASGYVTVPASATIQDLWSGGGTLSFWIYPRSTGEGGSALIINASDAGSTTGWFARFASSPIVRLNPRFSGTNGEFRVGNTPLNRWSYVVISYNSDSASNLPTCTVNGVAQTITVVTPPVGTYVSDVGQNHIFGNNTGDTRTFDGWICDISYINAEITNTEKIFYTYSGALTSASIIERWLFRDGVGATLTGQNGNNGTITTATWSDFVPIKARTAI